MKLHTVVSHTNLTDSSRSSKEDFLQNDLIRKTLSNGCVVEHYWPLCSIEGYTEKQSQLVLDGEITEEEKTENIQNYTNQRSEMIAYEYY
tara:strand:+ start:171 stop:440 length:270 start_codon:yes stop_codon:yes gene_type:complete